MKLQDHLPVDHKLGVVYRYGAALTALVLLVFGLLGFADSLTFFDTHGQRIAGLSSNGLLSVISVVVAVILLGAALIGGNLASLVNMAVGLAFLLSGFVNLALLDTKANFLAFRLPNVIFSFVVGLMLSTFGMYGRVSGGLPHDNPYWHERHPEEARLESELREALSRRGASQRHASAQIQSGSAGPSAGAAQQPTATATTQDARPAGQQPASAPRRRAGVLHRRRPHRRS